MALVLQVHENGGGSPLDLDEIVSTMMSEIRSGVIASEEDFIGDFEEFFQIKTGLQAPQAILWDPMASKEFRVWLREKLRRDAVEWHKGLSKMVQSWVIPAWRAVVADEDWIPGAGRHIGVHWTYTEHLATAYDAAEGTHVHVVEADIPEASIDWTQTVLHHMTRDVEEDEITIREDAKVTVIGHTKKPNHPGVLNDAVFSGFSP